MPRLKAQLHVHTRQDPIDGIKLTEKQIIDHAASHRYDVLAISCHNVVIFNEDLKAYAEKKRILLIPALEKSIQRKHVLILNANIEAQNIKTFEDLKEYRKRHPDCFVVAAHPYYPGPTSLGKKLDKHSDLFDAVEYSWYHTHRFNRANEKAVKAAEQYGLPLLGTSDNHLSRYFNHTYSIIDADKDPKSIFSAIKNNKVKIVSHDLQSWQMLSIISETLLRRFFKYFTLR